MRYSQGSAENGEEEIQDLRKSREVKPRRQPWTFFYWEEH
jgi:hypothetical protein